MKRQATIERKPRDSLGQDYLELRRLGIEWLEELVTDTWVDFGASDPGITILEAVAYAVTDVAYRLALPFEDLIAPMDPGQNDVDEDDQAFYTAAEILPTEPLTHLDWRKLIIDRVEGVRNCWLEPVTQTVFVDAVNLTQSYTRTGLTEPKHYDIKGLYVIRVEGEDDAVTDEKVKRTVEALFHEHRALCEDLLEVRTLSKQGVTVCADIELAPDANTNETFAEIVFHIEQYMSPTLPRYTLDELLQKDIPIDEIFTGPRALNGFVLDEDLLAAEPRQVVYGSDLINLMLSVPGVVAIDKLELNYAHAQSRLEVGPAWELPLNPNFKPRFDVEKSKFCLAKDLLPISPDVNSDAFKDRLTTLRRQHELPANAATDIPIPYGRTLDVSSYRSVQYEFPQVYGLAGKGLSRSASPERRAQAQQLKGYLLLFDQLLADMLAQLHHVRDFMAVRSEKPSDVTTYYSQTVEGLENVSELFNFQKSDDDPPSESEIYARLGDRLKQIHRGFDDSRGLQRRHKVLDHLLARFGEHFGQYTLLFQELKGGGFVDQSGLQILGNKIKFLKDYPTLSRRRSSAFDLNGPAWDTATNIPGIQQRAGRLLGIEDVSRKDIAEDGLEGMFVLENVLLRPPASSDVDFIATCFDGAGELPMDPYSFRVHVIVPAYAGRLGDERKSESMAFRRFIEKTIREELPAHVMPKICFVDKAALVDLEKHYRVWLKHRASDNAAPELVNNALKKLLKALQQVHNEYPARKLHSLGAEGAPRPIILDQSHLGDPDDDP